MFFLDHSLDTWNKIESKVYPLHMSRLDEIEFENSNSCKICKRKFNSDIIKTRHHDHYEPRNNFIGALCQRCNLSIKRQNKFISIAHNSSYDALLIIKFCSLKMCIHFKFLITLSYAGKEGEILVHALPSYQYG